MSKEKVDKYREDKLKRKELLEKEKHKKKQQKILRVFITSLVCVLLVGALVLTGVNMWKNKEASAPDYNRDALIISDIAGVLETEAEAEEEEPEADADETAETE